MKILGICHDVWICSAALVVDGEVVAAMAEERLDRRKRSNVFPTLAVEKCLEMGGLRIGELDEIAVAWNPVIEMETMPAGFYTRRWRSEHAVSVPARIKALLGQPAHPLPGWRNLTRDAPPVTFVDHYLAHIGNAVFLSPFDDCAVLILDGRGERMTQLMARVKGVDVTFLDEVCFPHSLGLFYGAITQFLGFRPDSDEWKVMALSSFAPAENEYTDELRKLLTLYEDGGFEVDLSYFGWYNYTEPKMYSPKLVELLGQPRSYGEELTERHEKIAAALQTSFEECVSSMLGALHRRTGASNLVVSGGCFMNSVINGKLDDRSPFKESFITGCPDDSGTSVGAALYLESVRTGKRPAGAMKHNFWGPGFTDSECLDTVKKYNLPHEVVGDPAVMAAEDLVRGRLVGWFQGRMEFGQRALGNRSILADPRDAGTKDRVNLAVKYRESFRPFAPSIIAERVADYFQCRPKDRVPFMERVLNFRPEKTAEVPAVVHVDGTGRLQTVDRETNPLYYKLISHFEEKTGVPIILNTSFNLNGEAIVCTPTDAIRTFYSCGLDVLYLGNVRLAKNG
ncbi:MAG TPA: carbamoyltransferase C-terminal domain-containing protein [bacterium]|nr:carbamoyltransferase C-terminal domain-containing protein [bacterium]